jgi:hypothetical protein
MENRQEYPAPERRALIEIHGRVERNETSEGCFMDEMGREARCGGIYETGGMKVPRLQILTAEQILDNRRPQVPFGFTEGEEAAKVGCFELSLVMYPFNEPKGVENARREMVELGFAGRVATDVASSRIAFLCGG